MRRRLQADLGKTRNGITAALRHPFDLLENQAVVISGERCVRCEAKNQKKNRNGESLHGRIDKRQNAIWQRRVEEEGRFRRSLAFPTDYARRKRMLRFTKMNGAGNDFVLIDNRAGEVRLNRSQIAHLCDRHRGIGADGVLLLEKPSNRADFRMRYFNADGGEAEMCGNGARCFARFANKVAGTARKISLETPAGVISADLVGDLVTLQMTEPTDLRLNVSLRVANKDKVIHFINTGVPHVVIPVLQVDDVDVQREGAAIRQHEMFSPKGANVNFIEMRGANKIAVRTYERGVEDETLACGTGVVASALIFAVTEDANGPIGVLVRGGNELKVDFEKTRTKFKNVTLTGPADFVFEGMIEV